MNRVKIKSGTKWEPVVGYSRAYRIGNHVYVSGTTATDSTGNVVGSGDAYRQAVQAIENIASALEKAGAGLEDIVRTRIYVTDMSYWQEVGKAHGAYFGEVLPATSLVEVSALIDPDMLVEIEAVAVVD